MKKYNDHVVNKTITNHEISNSSSISFEGTAQVPTKNFFGVHDSTIVEIHQENKDNDNDDDDENQDEIDNEEEISRQNKRSHDKMSPTNKNTTVNRSVRPKILRNQNKMLMKVMANEPCNSEKEPMIPSPVLKSKLKNTRKPPHSFDLIHKENCICASCTEYTSNTYSKQSHNSYCGCHDCFIEECNAVKPLTKDKLINMIRTFINSKTLSEKEPLASHQTDCMCKGHLIYYKQNKITILDKLLNQSKEKNNLSNNSH